MSETVDKPVFCTEKPSLLGGAFNDDDTKEKVKSQALRLRGNPRIEHVGFMVCYFHGKLEAEHMHYDIVNIVDGCLPALKYGDVIPCVTITPDGKRLDTVMCVGKSRYPKGSLRAYIILPDDVDSLSGVDGFEGEFPIEGLKA